MRVKERLWLGGGERGLEDRKKKVKEREVAGERGMSAKRNERR